jgi:hypothetical protein
MLTFEFCLCCPLPDGPLEFVSWVQHSAIARRTNGTYFSETCVDGQQLLLNIMGILEMMPSEQRFHSQKPEEITRGQISRVKMEAGPHLCFCGQTFLYWHSSVPAHSHGGSTSPDSTIIILDETCSLRCCKISP